jgi:hypothetical protein
MLERLNRQLILGKKRNALWKKTNRQKGAKPANALALADEKFTGRKIAGVDTQPLATGRRLDRPAFRFATSPETARRDGCGPD